MAIMVTGGTGFIGSRIVRNLLEKGETVVSFDIRPASADTGSEKLIEYQGDVMHMPHLMEAVENNKVTKVIHTAALLPPGTEDHPQHGMLVNIHGSNNIFELARWKNIERVVYASSIACYGVQENFGERKVTERDVGYPANVYGLTKLANDFSAGQYIKKFNLDLRGVQICTVFGYGRVRGMTGLIGGLLMTNPAIGQSVEIPADPSEASPMIYVDDVAEIFVRLLFSKELKHYRYLSGGHLATLGEMADIVKEYLPDADITLGTGKVPHIYLVDNSNLVADIGYELAPMKECILAHINEARESVGLASIS